MEEGNLVAPGTGAGHRINKADPLPPEAGEGFGEVRDPVGDVMEARAPPMEEPADGGLRAEGLQEFDGAGEADPDALGLQGLDRGTGSPGEEFEETASLLQGGHGHGDVVQRVGKHIRVVAWKMRRQGPGGAPTPAAWYRGPPIRTRSSLYGR